MNAAGTSSVEAWETSHAAPPLDLDPIAGVELHAVFRGGEPGADVCERFLAMAARLRGAMDVAIAEGLDALRKRGRLVELAYHLDDYGREVLDLGPRATQELARLGRELATRPLLREALRSGRVKLRAAQTILRVAVGDEEARWVERAETSTVRELETAVRRAGQDPGVEEDPWLRLRAGLSAEERESVDGALELAREIDGRGTALDGLEAIAQEYLGEHPVDPAADDPAAMPGTFRPVRADVERLAAAREVETERWAVLPEVPEIPAPDVRFYDTATAEDVDRKLRHLARLRAASDDQLGYYAYAVKKSRMYALIGFATFRHYVEERLGLPARAIEQRAAVEERRWASPALQEAKRQGLPFEKLRLLSRLPEEEIAAWTPRAHALTCVALRRALDRERVRQLRARRRLSVALPLRVAALLAGAFQAARERAGKLLSPGACLAVIARHFVDTWARGVKRSPSRSRTVRERDERWCQVPGCSHAATHAHHVLFRSHGGGDELENQIGLCAFHHLRCIHGGSLRVIGKAPDALRWFLRGEPWAGPRTAVA